jgi:predicted phage baseplate assembly protein
MTMLPAPNLDDRTFQSLVDDARRLVHRRCPEWSDHNISDPGITLIETFAMMVDQLIYRLNRVPDRNYIKFLELLGLELRPPGAAQGEVTFWLSAPQPQTIIVRNETEVSTDRTDVQEPIVFSTTQQLDIIPCSLESGRVATVSGRGEPADQRNEAGGIEFRCFSERPSPGDALLIGLDNAVPSCAVLLRFDCRVSGVGVDPTNPPYVWEAWTGGPDWVQCDLERDETKAFNKPGDVILHVPRGHVLGSPPRIGGEPRGWLRCRLVEPVPGQSTYSESPFITSITASTIGGTARIVHARVVRDESIGRSDGTAGQRFALQHRPVLPWDGSSLSVAVDGESTEWRPVDHFGAEDESSRCFHIDPVAGEVVFGPAVREGDGTLRQYGAIPRKSASLRMSAYRTGGGKKGNVGRGQIRVLKTSVPYISRVENRRSAVGGAEAETVDEVKARGPMLLRTRGKAVTAQDFVQLTLEVAPEVARAHCLTAANEREAGVVRMLIVPHVSSDALELVRREDLDPLADTIQRIKAHLNERRLVGTRLVIEPPAYRGVTVVVTVSLLPGFPREQVKNDVVRALNRLLHPLKGGPDGSGWPIGRAVQVHEVTAALAWIPGVDMAEKVSVQLFPVDPSTGERAREPVDVIALARNELVYSFGRHSVRVLER